MDHPAYPCPPAAHKAQVAERVGNPYVARSGTVFFEQRVCVPSLGKVSAVADREAARAQPYLHRAFLEQVPVDACVQNRFLDGLPGVIGRSVDEQVLVDYLAVHVTVEEHPGRVCGLQHHRPSDDVLLYRVPVGVEEAYPHIRAFDVAVRPPAQKERSGHGQGSFGGEAEGVRHGAVVHRVRRYHSATPGLLYDESHRFR